MFESKWEEIWVRIIQDINIKKPTKQKQKRVTKMILVISFCLSTPNQGHSPSTFFFKLAWVTHY